MIKKGIWANAISSFFFELGKTACWASAGYNATGCLAVENQLRACMDGPPAPRATPSTINYHLGRMQRYVTSQPKKR